MNKTLDISDITEDLLRESSIFDENYYSKFHHATNEVMHQADLTYADSMEFLLQELDILVMDLEKCTLDDADMKAASTIIPVLLGPLYIMCANEQVVDGKKYSDFNIQLPFFKSLRNHNFKCIFVSAQPDRVFYIKKFEMVFDKLSSFSISRAQENPIEYYYDVNYSLKSMIFENGNSISLGN